LTWLFSKECAVDLVESIYRNGDISMDLVECATTALLLLVTNFLTRKPGTESKMLTEHSVVRFRAIELDAVFTSYVQSLPRPVQHDFSLLKHVVPDVPEYSVAETNRARHL
jgi:hypothetical protein